MSVIDVSSPQNQPHIQESNRQFWDVGMRTLFWDHIKRGLQIGSIFGTFVVLPYTIAADLKNLKALNFKRIMNKQAAALTLGVGVSMLWMGLRYASWSNK